MPFSVSRLCEVEYLAEGNKIWGFDPRIPGIPREVSSIILEILLSVDIARKTFGLKRFERLKC